MPCKYVQRGWPRPPRPAIPSINALPHLREINTANAATRDLGDGACGPAVYFPPNFSWRLEPSPQGAAGLTVGLPGTVALEGEQEGGRPGTVSLQQADGAALMNMNRLLLHGAGPIRFLHTSPSPERLLRIKCKSHIYWYESDQSVTFSQQRV